MNNTIFLTLWTAALAAPAFLAGRGEPSKGTRAIVAANTLLCMAELLAFIARGGF